MTESPRLAVFPGSFDPLTNGHVDVIERAARLFDQVVVAVLVNPAKVPLFSVEERLACIREAFANRASIQADRFDGLLVEYARRRHAVAIIRGLRRAGDFDYEVQMTDMNRHLEPDVETVLLVPSPQVAFISSSLVREIAALGGSVDGLVPEPVVARLQRRRDAATRQRA
jgi:pantetheine-phosphate adenylyltransferase